MGKLGGFGYSGFGDKGFGTRRLGVLGNASTQTALIRQPRLFERGYRPLIYDFAWDEKISSNGEFKYGLFDCCRGPTSSSLVVMLLCMSCIPVLGWIPVGCNNCDVATVIGILYNSLRNINQYIAILYTNQLMYFLDKNGCCACLCPLTMCCIRNKLRKKKNIEVHKQFLSDINLFFK